jgi:glutathione S-transferase
VSPLYEVLLFIHEQSTKDRPFDGELYFTVMQWIAEVSNSFQPLADEWVSLMASHDTDELPRLERVDMRFKDVLQRLNQIVTCCQWLCGPFTVADIMATQALRHVDRHGGLSEFAGCRNYIERATNRRSFAKAYTDQLAHSAALLINDPS